MRRLRTLLGLAALCGGLTLVQTPARAQSEAPILIFAAASLTDAMEEIGALYESETGRPVTFAFAGSMTLARQIEASAGPDLYLSADVESMDYLQARGFVREETRVDLLSNELVFIAPADRPLALNVEDGFDLSQALGGGRLAVANTLTVPAGRYARAALESLGAWDEAEAALAEGEDVRAALSFVARGEAPLGIVYATDAAIEPRVSIAGRFPRGSHPPIRYPAALTRDARPEAEDFLAFLRTGAALRIFERAGFVVLAP